jgi:hypothetical protein
MSQCFRCLICPNNGFAALRVVFVVSLANQSQQEFRPS